MDAGTLSTKDIFGMDCRYVVPLYQRPYVWNKEDQWQPLWEDVQNLAERVLAGASARPHFLGAIVLDQVRTPTGHLDSRLVIDGQQRLTTLQLLLEAFSDICTSFQEPKYHQALLKLTRNDDPMSEDDDEEFKIWPTNVDQEHFRRVMRAESAEQLRKAYGCNPGVKSVGQRLGDAYLYFHETIEEWLGPEPQELERRINALYRALRESIRLVVIDLGKEDDPQLIFETLNARGTPLQPSDLVKNLLFHRVTLEQAGKASLNPLYHQYWASFDAENGYWREEIARGRVKRPRLDLFLQHYLTLRTRDEVPVTHLYKVFQDFVDSDATSAREELESIRNYAEVFRSFDHQATGSREEAFFERLGVMDTSTAYPFLMEFFAMYGEHADQIQEVLIDLESYLVRRMICRLTTKNYNRMFVDLLSLLDDPEDGSSVSRRVREALLRFEGESTRWPRDEELKQAWMDDPAYKSQVRRRVRMVLEALEKHLYTGMTERVQVESNLTVEHLMPQQWSTHWPLPADAQAEVAEIERNRLLHTFGNLTLVTKKLNPSISNGPWSTKRSALAEHSALRLNARLQKEDVWDEAAIGRRGTESFEWARRIWPFPDAK